MDERDYSFDGRGVKPEDELISALFFMKICVRKDMEMQVRKEMR